MLEYATSGPEIDPLTFRTRKAFILSLHGSPRIEVPVAKYFMVSLYCDMCLHISIFTHKDADQSQRTRLLKSTAFISTPDSITFFVWWDRIFRHRLSSHQSIKGISLLIIQFLYTVVYQHARQRFSEG